MDGLSRWGWLVSSVLVVVLGLVVLGRGPGEIAPAAITEVGTSTVQASPDTAVLQLGVSSVGATAEIAISRNDTLMARVEKAIEGIGLPVSDLQTISYNLYPQYGGGSKDQPVIVGYSVSDTLQITTTDLQLVGRVLSVGIANGANSVQNVQYEVVNQQSALAKAQTEAIAEARAEAVAAAAAMGKTLGAIISVTELAPSAEGPFPYNAQASYATSAGSPVLPGAQPVSVTVSVDWSVH